MPAAATPAATQVRGGTASRSTSRARNTVISAPRLESTSALATLVSESATTKAVKAMAHMAPEARPGQPAARSACQGAFCRSDRKASTNAKANRLRQNTISSAGARSTWRMTTPALLKSTVAATISATAVARLTTRSARRGTRAARRPCGPT
jgi:hypothetical protein